MAEGKVGGSDESFISFAFAVTSVVMIVLYIPWIISKVRGVVLYYKAPKKLRTSSSSPLDEMMASLCYIPSLVFFLAKEPVTIIAGAKICMAEKIFFLRCVLPKFLKFIIRPRILVLWLWLILFSSAMYATLTFDPHAILGLSSSATTSDIKKAYRSLSKRYHPDHNKTEEARGVYVQVRRAYKALVDREAFEEEEQSSGHEFSVGVALPSFLTSREHDGLVLFGLLAVLIGAPLVAWYYFTQDNSLARLVWRVRFDKERVEHFMKHFGIPEDFKAAERRESRKAIRRLLISLGIIPENARDDVVNNFPPMHDFIQRCVEAERHQNYLLGLGLHAAAIQVLHEYMVTHAVTTLEEFEAAVQNLEKENDDVTVHMIDPSAYRATRYLFRQHTVQVDAAVEELLEAMGGNLPSARKLLNVHEEIYDLLDIVYNNTAKPNKQVVKKLMAIPQRVCDIVDAIEPEIQLAYRRHYKSHLMQQAGGKQMLRSMKAASRRS